MAVLANSEIELPAELKNKTMTIVLGNGPGGPPDIFSRLIAKKIKDKYNIDIVILNRPGAFGAVAARHTADAAPDGTTMFFTGDTYMIGSLRNLSGWPKKHELVPAVNTYGNYLVLMGSNRFEKYSFSDVMAEIKKNPGKFNYASIYVIDGYYIDLILNYYNGKAVEIPFKSTPEVTVALINDTVQLWATGLSYTIQAAANKQVVPLLITSPTRSKALPNVPTIGEVMPGTAPYQSIYTMYFPEKTPVNILKFYNNLFNAVLKDPEITSFITSGYLEPIDQDFETTQKTIDDKWKTFRSQIK